MTSRKLGIRKGGVKNPEKKCIYTLWITPNRIKKLYMRVQPSEQVYAQVIVPQFTLFSRLGLSFFPK